MPKTELYLIRHAESHANTQPHIIGGRSNHSPITEKGIQQAKRLGAYFLAEDIIPDEVYSSPAVRTLQTARHTLGVMGVKIMPKIDEALQELDQGDWVGQKRAEMYNEETFRELERLGKDFKAPNGESMNETGDRVLECANRIVSLDEQITDSRRVFVFIHGLATRCLASRIHGWSQARTFEKCTDNTSFSLFIYRDGIWQLEYLGKMPE